MIAAIFVVYIPFLSYLQCTYFFVGWRSKKGSPQNHFNRIPANELSHGSQGLAIVFCSCKQVKIFNIRDVSLWIDLKQMASYCFLHPFSEAAVAAAVLSSTAKVDDNEMVFNGT